MKKFNIFLSVIFLLGHGFFCKASLKPFPGALICAAKMQGVLRNPCIKLCKPQDAAQAHKILCQYALEKVIPEQSEKLTLVYEKNQAIVGVCIAGFDGFVWRLAADKKYQKQGIGQELLQETIFRLQSEHQAQSLSLQSVQSAIPFYEKMGFDFYGHRYDYALGSLVFAKKDI